MTTSDKTSILSEVLAAIDRDDLAEATEIARQKYPWQEKTAASRKMNRAMSLEVFMRDGFLDRYSGDKLVFPGTLLLLSQVLPEGFPAHPNWRVAQTHDIYVELWPVVDHIVPIARGGADDLSNFATTSQRHNEMKNHWTLEHLGWELHPPGNLEDWDGLVGWFLNFLDKNPGHLEHTTIAGWHKTARANSSLTTMTDSSKGAASALPALAENQRGEFCYIDKQGNISDAAIHEEILSDPIAEEAPSKQAVAKAIADGMPVDLAERLYGYRSENS